LTDTCGQNIVHADEGHVFSRLIRKSSGPLWVTLELTRRCNLACPHCYQGHQQHDELAFDAVMSVLDQLAALGSMFLTITGGEVAAHPSVMDILRGAGEKRFVIKLKTNGTLWKPDDLAQLRQLSISEVHVSLYHVSPTKHDEFVGMPGAHDRTVNVIRYFHEHGIAVRVMVVLMNWNLDAARPLADWCARNGVPHTFDFRIEPMEDGQMTSVKYQADVNALADILPQIDFFAPQLPVREGAPAAADPVCALGQSNLLITASGDVYPCGVAGVLWLGNIYQQSIGQIWGSDRRLQLPQLTWGDDDACLHCEQSAFCHRCPVTSAVTHGDYTRHSPLDCRMATARRLAVSRLQATGKK
jgi:radical SAM protein with 4Fe4S-binding SPASM domain